MVKRKDGRWQETLTVTENGKTLRKYFYGKTKAEVAKKMAAHQQKQEAGRTFATAGQTKRPPFGGVNSFGRIIFLIAYILQPAHSV